MKNINMKKIVAGAGVFAVSALFAGAVAAANMADDTYTGIDNLTKDQLFGATGPAYNVIVGSMAQPVDVVWAGNIAAAIGKKAYTSGDAIAGAALESVTVTAGAESTSTISGDGELYDDYVIGETTASSIEDVDLDADNYSVLFDEDVDADDDAGLALADELTIKDTFVISNPLVDFDNDEDIADLTLTIEKETMTYDVDLDEGIYDDYDDSDASPALKIPFMGKEYIIDNWNGSKLTLVESISTQAYTEGATFDVDDYTVEVSAILDKGDDTGYEVELTLLNSDGVEVATEVYGNSEEVFEEYLDSSIETDTVYSSRVSMIVGASGKLELENGDLEDFPNEGDEFWKVTLEDDSNKLTGFKLENTNDFEFVDDDALLVGDSIELPNGFGSVEFLGLTSEATEDFTLSNNVIEYVDSSDEEHSLFIYEQDDTQSTFDEWTTDGEIDGDKIYFTFEVDTGDSDYTVNAYYNDEDGDSIISDVDMNKGWTSIYLPAEDGDINLNYGLYLYGDSSELPDEIALGLATDKPYNVFGNDSKTWKISKTAGDYVLLNGELEDANIEAAYVGQLKTSPNGTDDVVTKELEAAFTLVLFDGEDDMNVSVDVYEGDLIDTESDDWESGNYQVESDNADLGIHDSDDLTEAYTDYGTHYMIDGDTFTATLPEDQLYAQIFVGGGSSTSTVTNGSTFTLTTEGETQTENGVSVTLDAASVTGGAATEAIVPMTWNVATNKLVFLDNENPAGNKIIVGGHLVNTLAQNIGLDTMLTASGDYVLGQNAQGNIVVAGMTAEDTATAAKELITAIENM